VRRLLTAALGVIVVPSAWVILPVVTAPQPAAHAVAPTIYHLLVPLHTQGGGAAAGSSTFSPALRGLAAASAPSFAAGPQQDTKQFRAVGLSWKHDPKLTTLAAQVRVRTNGTWSGWQEVDSTDEGTDGGTDAGHLAARDGTDPLWVDHADGIQVQVLRVTGDSPSDLRVDLIDPGTSSADNSLAAAHSAATALADSSEPTIITRAQWGADESIRLNACSGGPESAGPIKVAFVHHTVTTNSYNPGDVPAIIRSIYAYHVQGEGWCDIGYNFLVDKFGRVFEGRYGGVENSILGAHTGGFNTDSFGVSMIGTYDTVTPPKAMTDALSQLIAWKFSMSYLNPEGQETLTAASFSGNRYPTGTNVTFNTISGHRDADLTACPGNAGYAVLPFVRQAVFAQMQAGLVDPTVATDPRSVAANGSVHITSGMLQAGSWQLGVADSSGSTVTTMSGSGSSVDATWTMTDASGQPVPAGQYTLTLASNQAGVDARTWSTIVTVGASFGALDSVSTATGSIHATGWAVHGTDDGTDNVRLTVSGSTVGTFAATVSRPDVASDHPGYSANHGFDQTVAASPGLHTVCAYGVNDVVGGPDSSLGCKLVTVPGAPPHLTGKAADPVGHLDAVQGGPAEVHVFGWALDPETASPINVAVYVDSTFAGYFKAASGRPDVAAAHPAYGSVHGFDLLVHGIGPGSHRVCAYAMNIGNGTTNPTLGCGVASVPTGNPTGHLDVVSSVPGGLVTWGWAIDPDTSGPITVQLYVDNRPVQGMTANLQRADVAAHYPLYGGAHGFASQLTLGGGSHRLCAYAINVGGGSGNVTLGCQTVNVLAGNPFGHLDSVVPSPGGVALWGWAIDPDTVASGQVVVSVDGSSVATLTASQVRPDVGAAYPAYRAAHGFASLLTLSGGKHTVCVNAINQLSGTANPQLGCQTVTVLAGNPIGHLDGATVAAGTATFWGWAIDPDVTAPIAVHIYVDGKLATITSAAGGRPDVARLYPSYGIAHGFFGQLPLVPGTHRVCAFAINTASGSTNPELGCLTVKA